jgi:zinc transport system ATP-binding protein
MDSPVSVFDLVATTITREPIWLGMKESVREKAMDILKKVASEKLIDKRIGELSGGELQRVLLAMAMTPVPDLLLLDEPISAADVKGISLFYEIVNGLKRQYDISIILVTHNLTGIVPYADRMILLNKTIIAEGTPKEVLADKKMLDTFQMSL